MANGSGPPRRAPSERPPNNHLQTLDPPFRSYDDSLFSYFQYYRTIVLRASQPARTEGLPGHPPWPREEVPARISHTHGPKRTPRNRNLLNGVTVPREARTLTGVTGCGMGDTDLQPVLPLGAGTACRRRAESRIATHRDGSRLGAVPIPGGGVPVPGRTSAQSALRRSPRFAGRCRPPPGELARGRPSSPGGGSLACASLRLVAWAPCAGSASAWRLLRLGERSRG